MKKVSVIIPMYNAESSILKALDSIKNQTYQGEFDILVINDGSTDQSQILVEQYIAQHPNLKIQLIHQKNKGVSAARNTGLRLASGEFIALLDSDDEWLPEKTEKQLAVLENPKLEIDFLGSLRNGEKIWFPYKTDENNLAKITLKKLLLRIDAQTSTIIFKRKIFENTGYYDENQRYSEDANYWMRITEKNNMAILAEDLVFTGGGKFSCGESGLSANLEEMEKGFQKNLSEMYQMKRINSFEYLFYFLFFKLKYWVRIVRVKSRKFNSFRL